MPPKNKNETPLVAEVPDQHPGFDNDGFMEEMLAKAKVRDIKHVEEGVANALKVEDYKISLRTGVLVDFHVEVVAFCAENAFPPRKTAAFVKWMNELRAVICDPDNEGEAAIDKAKEMFKEHLVSHAERSTKDAAGVGSDPANPPEGEVTQGAGTGAGAGSSVPPTPATKVAPGKKDAAKKGVKGGGHSAVDPDAASRPVVDTNIYLAVGDMGAVADFVVGGLLQHWRLYRYVALQTDMGADHQTITLNIQVPMKAPPLIRALNQEQYDVTVEDQKKVAELELEKRQAEEAAAIESERLDNERKEQERLALEEEERQNVLFFEQKGTERAVSQLQAEMEEQTLSRQQDIIARIAKLEAALAPPPSAQ